MAGIFAVKLLGEGQLSISKTVLYTVPSLTNCIIKTISLTNTGADALINLYIKKSGSLSRRIIPKDMQFGGGFLLETDEEYVLEAGDVIEGDASLSNQVDYTIHGVQET